LTPFYGSWALRGIATLPISIFDTGLIYKGLFGREDDTIGIGFA